MTRQLLGSALAAAAWIVSGCSPALAPAPPPGSPPDVVLIVIDTVRPDHLGLYGYERDTSPNLEALARGGRTWNRARSTSTWTSPAHASLFTGLYPGSHHTTQESWTLPESLSTVAEVLAERGYTTAAVVGNPMLTQERGFAQGFDTFEETWRGAGATTDRRSLAEIKDLVPALPSPFFLFVNLIGPHSPYDSCGPECERWVRDPFRSPRSNRWRAVYRGRHEFQSEELARLGGLYDAELRRADAILGEIVASIRQRGRIDETLLVVTSDHGENLGDHEHIDHVFSLYDSTVRVPLVIRQPERFVAGSRSDALAQLPDLFSTILSAAGIAPGEATNQGIDLAHDEAIANRPHVLEYYEPVQAIRGLYRRSTPEEKERLDHWNRKLEGIVTNRYKLVRASDGATELFDLTTDSGEHEDLSGRADHRALRSELEASLDAWLARYSVGSDGDTSHAPVSEETRRALEAIGYIE